jgi:hypothetical protein
MVCGSLAGRWFDIGLSARVIAGDAVGDRLARMATAHASDSSPTGPFGLRLSSLIRAAGTATTILSGKSPGLIRTGVLAGGSYLAAREVDPAGLQIVSFTPGGAVNVISGGSGKAPDYEAQMVQIISSTASWIGANLLLAKLARVLPWSRPVTALLAGAGVYIADDAMAGVVEKVTGRRPAE